jgi:type IV pilus modification protein PilV
MAIAHPSQRTFGAHRQAGFSLIEALIALLVVAFGLLGIASFQFTLSHASDVAKQRTEATRIAQAELDRLRSFVQREAETTPTAQLTYVEDLVSAGPTPVAGVATNTTFNMQRVVTTPAGDRFRWINVIVSWADRKGQNQEVRLASAISDGDPSDLGVLGVTRRVSSTLRPKNRNINIPYPAVNLAGGVSSAFVPPPGNATFVFNNVTGNVTESCRATNYQITGITRSGTTAIATTATGHPFTTGMRVIVVGASPTGYNGTVTVTSVNPGVSFSYTVANGLATPASLIGATASRAVTLTEGIDLATLTGVTCTSFATPAYLLSGYVRFKTQGAAANASNIDDPSDLTDDTRPLAPTVYDSGTGAFTSQPLTITSTATSHTPSAYECYAQRQVTARDNNAAQSEITIEDSPAAIAALPSGYNVGNNSPRFVSYTCVVTPVAVTGVPTPIWSGEVTLNPLVWTFGTSGNLGATTGTGRLCRFTSDYNRNSALANGEHPRYYRQVSGALDNQNYLVVNGGDTCPTDIASDPASGNYLDTNTAQHQPNPSLSFYCLNAGCNGANRVTSFETMPANPAAAIPME